MKTLKNVLISLLVVCMVFSLASCGKKAATTTTTTTTAEAPVEKAAPAKVEKKVPVFTKDANKTEGVYSGKTVILHSNDVHGAVERYQYMAGVKSYYVANGANVILVDDGDFSNGKTYVSINKGADAVTIMNAVGYDVVALGNHEFDFGYDQLKKNLASSTAEVLCCNIFEGDNTIFDGCCIYQIDGVKIGFLAVDTPETQTKVNPGLIKAIRFTKTTEEMCSAAQTQVDKLKKAGADIIICLAHLGVDAESVGFQSYDLLKGTNGIDFVIDGHSHTVMKRGDNGEPIQSTGTEFQNIGVIIIDDEEKAIKHNYLLTGNAIEEHPDATVAAVAQKVIDEVDAKYNVKFATSEVDLNGAKAPGNRTEETNNGDLITDAMLWSVTKDIEGDTSNYVAITNGGGIRAAIKVGDVTMKDVNTVLPFGNTIATVYVKGSQLLEALEASTFSTPTAVGGFPQIAGMEIEIDTTKAYDANAETYPGSTYYGPKSINRVTIKSVNGKAFDPNATYAVITNNFCAAGGDTYYAFAACSDQFDTGIVLDIALMNYITEELNGVIPTKYAAPQGRITIK